MDKVITSSQILVILEWVTCLNTSHEKQKVLTSNDLKYLAAFHFGEERKFIAHFVAVTQAIMIGRISFILTPKKKGWRLWRLHPVLERKWKEMWRFFLPLFGFTRGWRDFEKLVRFKRVKLISTSDNENSFTYSPIGYIVMPNWDPQNSEAIGLGLILD